MSSWRSFDNVVGGNSNTVLYGNNDFLGYFEKYDSK